MMEQQNHIKSELHMVKFEFGYRYTCHVTTLPVWVVGLAVGPRDIPVGTGPGGRTGG